MGLKELRKYWIILTGIARLMRMISGWCQVVPCQCDGPSGSSDPASWQLLVVLWSENIYRDHGASKITWPKKEKVSQFKISTVWSVSQLKVSRMCETPLWVYLLMIRTTEVLYFNRSWSHKIEHMTSNMIIIISCIINHMHWSRYQSCTQSYGRTVKFVDMLLAWVLKGRAWIYIFFTFNI